MWISPQIRVTRCAIANPKIIIQVSYDIVFYPTPKIGRWSTFVRALSDAYFKYR